MMHKELKTSYAKVNDVEMVMLPYIGGTNCMELYLPAEGTAVKDIVSAINPEMLSKLEAARRPYEVTLSLPASIFSPMGVNELLPPSDLYLRR